MEEFINKSLTAEWRSDIIEKENEDLSIGSFSDGDQSLLEEEEREREDSMSFM